ncbi:hypothetical protein KBD87_04945 [Candidatus Saccharibacteria bacterium]|nr:hypothetical protein [Candidatus Saccharibacteria bacterium]
MTEKQMYNYVRAGLVATIIVPLVVGVFGLGAKANTTGNFSGYLSGKSSTSSVVDAGKKSMDTKKSSNAKSDESKATDGSIARAPATKAGEYTVKSGDTYGCIAENYYGSYEMWPKVYELNGGYPGFEEYHLDVGAKLQMPAATAGNTMPKTNVCQ